MRIFARRERPHPGAQLTLFEAGDGWFVDLRAGSQILTADPALEFSEIERPAAGGAEPVVPRQLR
jgi:hypothetical protein